MALSNATFTDIGSSVSDIFAGIGAQANGALQAEGLDIQAQGTQISAESSEITAESLRTQAAGNIAEATTYNQAAGLATENAAYTDISTRIQQQQQQRTETQAIGSQRAAEGGAGFSSGGTAFYLMKSSANQGALATGVIGQQGAITKAGYTEQAESYDTLAASGRATAAEQETMATSTDAIAGQENNIAAEQKNLAVQTQDAANTQATGDFVGSLIQGAAAVGSLLLAPATGGLSLAAAATIGADGLSAIH